MVTKSPKDSLNQQQTKKESKNASTSQKALNDNIAKLTEMLGTFGKSLDNNTKAISKANNISEKATKSQEKKEKEQKAVFDQTKQNRLINSLSSLKNSLDRMSNLSIPQMARRKDLSKTAKELRQRAYEGEDVTTEMRKLQYDTYGLQIDKDRYNQSAMGLLQHSATTTPKLEGFMSMALGAVTGINPVFLKLFGLDKAAKWAGGKAVNALSGFGGSLMKPIFGGNDEDDDGLANGTGKLKSKSNSDVEALKNDVASIKEHLSEDRKEKDGEKKEDEGGILAGLMGIIGSVLGVAAAGAVSLLAVAGKGVVSSMIKTVLEGVGVSEGVADFLGDTVSSMLPGAILGFKFGGFTGALLGAGLSLAYFTIRDQVRAFSDVSNGKIPENVGPLSGTILKGAIAGAALGAIFGPVGIIAGAVIGAGAGWISDIILKGKIEALKEKAAREEKEGQITQAAEKGVKYADIATTSQDKINDIKSYLAAHPEQANDERYKDTIKHYEKMKKVEDDYEEERRSVQRSAMKKFGTDDLSKLDFKQLKSIMYDDDAEFETYLTELESKGLIKNDEKARRSLRNIWQENKDMFGENKDSKKAVFEHVYNMVNENMPTEQEILQDAANEQAQANAENLNKSIQENKATVGGTTINQISQTQQSTYAPPDMSGQTH